ncbi:MAG TPA: S8 family serine peptidase [Thermoanaerobaculia bacterium]|nr:S8 family serine peptidase [Thermoanaerobaculia bacterium]
MAIRNLVVQCLSEEDQTAVSEVLKKRGPVTWSGMYVYGAGEDADVKALEDQGLLVEEIPTQPDLSWLEPGKQDETASDELLAMAEEEPADPSPIQEAAAGAENMYMIQLKGPIHDDWKARLEALGVELASYVPEYAYKAKLTDEQKSQVEDLSFVVRVVIYSAVHTLRRLNAIGKIRKEAGLDEDRLVRGGGVFGMAPPPPARVTYEVRCHEPENIPVVAAALEKDSRAKNLVIGKRRVRFDCEEDSPIVAELAKMPQVSSVDLFQLPELANNFARKAIGINPPQGQNPLPWDGTGQIVAVADSGVDENHPDLKNRLKKVIHRVNPGEPNDPNGHGTHVCGTIAGDGTASGKDILGMAPGAELIVQALLDAQGRLTGIPINLGDLYQEAYDLGARIHNNSWGVIAGGLYTLDSYEVDEFVYNHPDCLVIFAAGNRGTQVVAELDDLGRISLTSLQSPAAAKNVLTVGACCSPRDDGPYKGKTWKQFPNGPQKPTAADEPISGDLDYVAAFSSRGPTDDNRIKPEIVAPGTVLLSTRSEPSDPNQPYDEKYGGKYAFLSGTSMAAPVVTGAAAIVRQYYVDERQHQPSAALLKATLVNGAVWIPRETVIDATVGQPNFHQGFGRLDLRRALPVPGDPSGLKLVFADVDRNSDEALKKEIPKQSVWKRTVHVEAGLPFRVTIAWTDRPAHGLQQSLDLVVLGPDGKRKPGNPDLVRVPGQKSDHFNNLQQVTLEDPQPGEYRIQVLAYNTLFEAQGFSLVATGKLASDLLP